MNWRKVLSWEEEPRLVHYLSCIDGTFENSCDVAENEIEQEKRKPASSSNIRFVTCPDCKENIILEDLMNAHRRETNRRHADFTNYGWYISQWRISSKTNQGTLTSEIDPQTKRVTHSWDW
jgi:hypothetical protein